MNSRRNHPLRNAPFHNPHYPFHLGVDVLATDTTGLPLAILFAPPIPYRLVLQRAKLRGRESGVRLVAFLRVMSAKIEHLAAKVDVGSSAGFVQTVAGFSFTHFTQLSVVSLSLTDFWIWKTALKLVLGLSFQ